MVLLDIRQETTCVQVQCRVLKWALDLRVEEGLTSAFAPFQLMFLNESINFLALGILVKWA